MPRRERGARLGRSEAHSMVTISISAEAYQAITGGPPAPSLRDDRGSTARRSGRGSTLDERGAGDGVGGKGERRGRG